MLAHAFLAAMTAHTLEKGVEETVRAALFPSPWQKSGGSWTLPIPPQSGTGHLHTGSTGPTDLEVVGFAFVAAVQASAA